MLSNQFKKKLFGIFSDACLAARDSVGTDNKTKKEIAVKFAKQKINEIAEQSLPEYMEEYIDDGIEIAHKAMKVVKNGK